MLTPEAHAKGQAFDACPLTLMDVKPATWKAFRTHTDEVQRKFAERIEGFVESLARV